jgi:hypothetical protein
MTFLLPNDEVGQLVIGQVFVYFDGPRLFVAENPGGQRYIVNSLDSDDENSYWLMSAVSERRLFALLDGRLHLEDVFKNPEMGKVLRLVTDNTGHLSDFQVLQPSDLTSDDLPAPGFSLTIEDEPSTVTNAAFLAKSLNASILLLYLFPGRKAKEAPAYKVGKILTAFGDYVSTKIRSFIPSASSDEDASKMFQLNMIGTFAGSFGVELAVRGDDPRIATAIKDAIEELGSADDVDVFKEHTAALGDEQVGTLKKFLGELKNAETDLKIEAASQSDTEAVTASVPLRRLKEAVRSLKREPSVGKEQKTLVADLIAISLRTRKFEIKDIDNKETIRGSMEAVIFQELRTIVLPGRYRVVIEADVRMSPTGNKHLSNWRMISATKL